MTHATRFATFATALGSCAIAWRGPALVGVALPGTTDDVAEHHLRRRHPGAQRAVPPAEVQEAIARMVLHLDGALQDFTDLGVDLDGVPAFEQRVYALTRAIPAGATRTYGELAAALGDPTLARAVGQAMGRNPLPLVIPCHRVLAAGGSLGGFSAPGGADTKRRMLEIERAPAVAQGSLFG